MMIICIILIVFAIYALSGNMQNGGFGSGNEALKILEDRYAKGEIGDDEYIKKRDLILKK